MVLYYQIYHAQIDAYMYMFDGNGCDELLWGMSDTGWLCVGGICACVTVGGLEMSVHHGYDFNSGGGVGV